MLQTINGFDLMLIILIAGLLVNVWRLNRECESYVEQIIEVSQDNYKLTKEIKRLDPWEWQSLDHKLLDNLIEPPF